MFEKNLSLEDRNELLKDALIVAFFLGFAFFINNGIKISGLYMDDLYMWSCYGEQSFREYVFPLGSTRFRPVYWFVAWLQLGIIRNHIEWIVPMNIIFATIIATYIYMFVKKLANSRVVAFIFGALFILSRFSYYDISQLLGLMEAMALLFVFFILRDLYYFIRLGKMKSYYTALVYYILVCFTHERFMVLLPIFIFVLIVRKNKSILAYLGAILSFAFVQVIRALTIGTVLPAGTGGTNVADTLTLKSLIKSSISEILYILGINAGPEHLNGVTWEQTPHGFKLIILAGIIVLAIYVLIFLCITFIRTKKEKSLGTDILYSIFFLCFIGASIVSSAVTIRVEMRWIYAPYMFSLLYLAYMHGRIREYIKENNNILRFVPITILIIWAVLNLPFEFYNRSKYDKIYLFPNQNRYNSLADVTYGKYGEAIFGKNIYIVGNRFEMSDFTADTFFKVYSYKKNVEEAKIIHVDSIKDLPTLKDTDIALQEDFTHDKFIDITSVVKEIKLRAIKGYYSDGWMDENASLELMSGREGKIEFELMYPGEIQGNELTTIAYDGKIIEVPIKENIIKLDIDVESNRIIHFDFKNNFYMKNAKEQRGEDRLSLIVNISSK